jgi:hypothetical protein
MNLGKLCKTTNVGKIATHCKTETVRCARGLDMGLGLKRLGVGVGETERLEMKYAKIQFAFNFRTYICCSECKLAKQIFYILPDYKV